MKGTYMFSILITIVLLLFACLLVASAIIAGGAGIGWILNWLLPSIEFDMATLIGVLALIPSILFLAQMKSSFDEMEDDYEEEDDDDDDDDDDELEFFTKTGRRYDR